MSTIELFSLNDLENHLYKLNSLEECLRYIIKDNKGKMYAVARIQYLSYSHPKFVNYEDQVFLSIASLLEVKGEINELLEKTRIEIDKLGKKSVLISTFTVLGSSFIELTSTKNYANITLEDLTLSNLLSLNILSFT